MFFVPGHSFVSFGIYSRSVRFGIKFVYFFFLVGICFIRFFRFSLCFLLYLWLGGLDVPFFRYCVIAFFDSFFSSRTIPAWCNPWSCCCWNRVRAVRCSRSAWTGLLWYSQVPPIPLPHLGRVFRALLPPAMKGLLCVRVRMAPCLSLLRWPISRWPGLLLLILCRKGGCGVRRSDCHGAVFHRCSFSLPWLF